MCGISGIFHFSPTPVSREILQNINRKLTHRGPDNEGYYLSNNIGLGHRRLSIIDLAGGVQPMTTPDGRYTLVFNGEIYNFNDIKLKLEREGVVFKTHSDTEVLLYLYALKKEKCLEDLNGMFSFAVWDNSDQKLFIARDRFGKKPLYYFKNAACLVFASEIKALLSHPFVSKEIDPQAVAHYFQYEYVPAPLSIFKSIRKLPHAHYLTASCDKIDIQRYWDIPLCDQKLDISEDEAVSKIDALLDSATERRMISDVPLGVFLSGGVDSSSLVALMARHRSGRDIKTFSINFNEKSFDESSHSDLVAKTFSTDHHAQVLDPQTMIAILPEIAAFMDEPFADYSIIPTYLLSRFTRQYVTVALGGDGSDEIFAGYPTFYAGLMATRFQKFPQIIKTGIQKAINLLPVSDKDMSFEFKIKQFLYGASYPPVLRNQVWLGALNENEMKTFFTPSFLAQTQLAQVGPLNIIAEALKACKSHNVADQMLYFYQKFYLTDDILVKTDRASMAHSLEVRAPFLDIKLVNFVSQLPYTLKSKGQATKYILKKTVQKFLPSQIVYRPKKGFGIPIARWLKYELKETMLDVLNPQKIDKAGIFNPHAITRLVQEHLQGKKNNRKVLFSLLMFEKWREHYAS
ncbi:asparagine synthase (glutamine-hydrolyzing) [bacterium]|nr:asparagine synthase (glutamine-hydrolyzing) [bacterium]